MGGCFFILAIICFIIGVVQLLAPEPAPLERKASRRLPLGGNLPSGGIPRPAGLDPGIHLPTQTGVRPAAPPAAAAGKPAGIPLGGEPLNATPQKLNWIELGQRIYVKHPARGDQMAHVLGRIQYTELWQTRRGPQSPWVPTGNVFLGFWLEGGLLLLSWQNRFYLLDESSELSDAEIQQHFAPFAKEFAQSDQTADVYFAYPPAMWHIDDIGKFRVERTEGEGIKFRPGAEGRFVHASGDQGRALVLEDYEGGAGGQDTVWTGYTISEADVKPA